MTYEEAGSSLEWKKKLLFSGIFIQENLLHTVFDRYNSMSCKQWLLLSVAESFDSPPDLSQVAKAMGCSRQNVKQLALHLQRDGYITLERSPADGRSLCICFTGKGRLYCLQNESTGEFVHEAIFREFSEEDIQRYFDLSVKMIRGIKHLEQVFQAQKEDLK